MRVVAIAHHGTGERPVTRQVIGVAGAGVTDQVEVLDRPGGLGRCFECEVKWRPTAAGHPHAARVVLRDAVTQVDLADKILQRRVDVARIVDQGYIHLRCRDESIH